MKKYIKEFSIIFLGKLVALASRLLSLGAGGTWPGEIALRLDKEILKKLVREVRYGIILIAGTNGKTTTAKMMEEILKGGYKGDVGNEGKKTVRNESGANLLNGLVSAFILKAGWLRKIAVDWAVFEVDEATLPTALAEFTPKIVVLLNLFRDQLDRYGEVDLIAEKWLKSLKKLKKETTVILNADDPQIAHLGKDLSAKVFYFGLNDPKVFLPELQHATDSIYCLTCQERLTYRGIYFSHLGVWSCPKCGQKRPMIDLSEWDYPLSGVYNRYNTLAAVLAAKSLGIGDKAIKTALKNFVPAFGRQEEFKVEGKKVRLLLSKNPTGFNESLRTLKEFPGKKKTLVLVLNDRIPDGRDVSWIWDVDFEMIPRGTTIIVSGDRAYDMGLRIKYGRLASLPASLQGGRSGQAGKAKFKIYEKLKEAIDNGLKETNEGETLYILPTYSAMLEARKIISGRKIL